MANSIWAHVLLLKEGRKFLMETSSQIPFVFEFEYVFSFILFSSFVFVLSLVFYFSAH